MVENEIRELTKDKGYSKDFINYLINQLNAANKNDGMLANILTHLNQKNSEKVLNEIEEYKRLFDIESERLNATNPDLFHNEN